MLPFKEPLSLKVSAALSCFTRCSSSSSMSDGKDLVLVLCSSACLCF